MPDAGLVEFIVLCEAWAARLRYPAGTTAPFVSTACMQARQMVVTKIHEAKLWATELLALEEKE